MDIRLAPRVVALAAAALLVLTSFGPPASAQAPSAASTYTIVELGTLGGDMSIAYGLNDLGQVVGVATTKRGDMRAVLWSDGKPANLGVFGNDARSEARDINNAGAIVGTSSTVDYGYVRSVRWDVGVMRVTDDGSSIATAVNASGVAVSTALGGALWSADGTLNMLSTMDGAACCDGPEDINATGVVGGGTTASGLDRAFRWANQTVEWLPSLSGASRAYSVNASGTAVGYSDSATDVSQGFLEHATVWGATGVTDLGTLGGERSEAYSINDAGQIVGWSLVSTSDTAHAFVTRNGALTDLNELLPPDSGWVLNGAWDINAAGQIAGWGTRDGATRAFLLSPTVTASSYNVCALYDPAQAFKAARRTTLTLQLCDTAGRNLSAASVRLRATSLTPGSLAATLGKRGSADFTFQARAKRYTIALDTRTLQPGTYQLTFSAAGSAASYSIEFRIR